MAYEKQIDKDPQMLSRQPVNPSKMGLKAWKPVLGISDQVRLEPVYSATENSLITVTLHVANLAIITIQRATNKGADQTAWMPRLVCAFVVCMQQSGFLAPRPKYICATKMVVKSKVGKAYKFIQHDKFKEAYWLRKISGKLSLVFATGTVTLISLLSYKD